MIYKADIDYSTDSVSETVLIEEFERLISYIRKFEIFSASMSGSIFSVDVVELRCTCTSTLLDW